MKQRPLPSYMYPQIEHLESELQTKQIQLNFLMRVTEAINENISASELFDMYSGFLKKELGVNRLAMFFREKDYWVCKKTVDYSPVNMPELIKELTGKYRDFSRVGEKSHKLLKPFQLIIPVFHKHDPLAYVLVGKMDKAEDEYDRFKFMITITNVVVVAIENKRLFNRQLEQESYKKELELAQQVQQMLIPSVLPDEPHLELSAIYRPHSDIGGDYVDYCKFDDGSFMICLADVSGKGIPAALLMANFQATLRSALMIYEDLDDLVKAVNTTLVSITKSDRIVTFFILKFDVHRKIIRYVNAGHNPPILLKGEEPILLKEGCTILGAIDDLGEIGVGEIDLGDNEALVLLYTDGLTDLMNGNGDYYDLDKLMEFAALNRTYSATDFNKKLLDSLELFKGRQEYPDDIAVLTCKIKPANID